MRYKNAKDIIPGWLLEALQKYAQGEMIYIPTKEPVKAGWGEANGTRKKYMERNAEIARLYNRGTNVVSLSELYCLSEHSIRKILSNVR